MKIKKKSNLIIVILTLVATIGLVTFFVETTHLTSDYMINSPKLSANSITITRPDSSSSWKAGDTEWIYYDTDLLTWLTFELYKDGIFVMEFGTEIASTGALLWAIPTDLVSSNQYQIKIIDQNNSSAYDMSDFFEIVNPQPTPTSPGIPGYNLYILIGVICIVSLIILNRKHSVKV